MHRAIRVMAFAMVMAPAVPLAAQETGVPKRPPPAQGEYREKLQTQMRERVATMVRTRLGLNDEQMRQLQQTNQKFEESRRLLMEQERELRMAMRDEMIAGDRANQEKVGQLLDRLLKVQRQRLELVESEQRDLAKFLTPVQRAKYLGLQDQMRRRMQEVRSRGQGGGRGAGAGVGGGRGAGRPRP